MNPVLWAVLRALVVAALGVVAVLAGSPLVEWIFARITPKDPAKRTLSPAEQAALHSGCGEDELDQPMILLDPDEEAKASQQLRGGKWIGMFERVAVYAAVLAGQPMLAIPIVAIKAFARFPELSDAKRTDVAEKFIIGTFASLLFATGLALAAGWLIRL